MAKVFDLVHKVAEPEEHESRIPFEDEPGQSDDEPKPKRPRIEVIFFYVLLFAVFFVMGMAFLSPKFLTSFLPKKSATPSPSPVTSPVAGFTIDKQGESVQDAAKDIGVPTPTPTALAATPSTAVSIAAAAPTPPTTTTNKTAKIQIQNGTTREGAAAVMRTTLKNHGIIVDSIANYKNSSANQTTIYYDAAYKQAAQEIKDVIGGVMINYPTATGSNDIVIVIGRK